jgi:hypothetical protein
MTVARDRCRRCSSPYTHTARSGDHVSQVCARHAEAYDEAGWDVTALTFRIAQLGLQAEADREAGAKLR